MAYPEMLIAAMRQDLTKYGVEEARTPADVDAALSPESGTVLVVVNSVCGCAAGKARPAVGMALQGPNKPTKTVTVFAGGDVDATDHLRDHHLNQFPPSSPSMAIFRDGKPVYYMHRHDIERRQAPEIAQLLAEALKSFAPTHQ